MRDEKLSFGELSEREFTEFVKKCVVQDFLQSVEMYRRYVKQSREVYLLGVKKGKKVVAGMVVRVAREVLGRKIFDAARGPAMNYAARDAGVVLETLTLGAKRFLRERGGMILEISPKVARVWGDEVDEKGGRVARSEERDGGVAWPEEKSGGAVWPEDGRTAVTLERLGYKDLGEYEQVKWIYTLEPAGRKPKELLAGFRKGHKLSIRYATERYGVKVRELERTELKTLKEVADAAGERHGFKAPSVEYFEEMAEVFGENVKFVVAEMKDPESGEKVAVAGAMFVIYGGEIVYLFSGSRSEYKKYGGPHLIQWEMIQLAARRGLKYNFYGTHPVKGDGVYAFKTGFRGQIEEYLGTYMLPLTLVGRLYLLRKKYAKYREVS